MGLVPSAVPAECFICDKVVEIDPAGQACFRENADKFLDAALRDPGKRTEVNLVTCGDPAARGLDTFPSVEDLADRTEKDASDNLRRVYFLDVAGIECLKDKLATAGTVQLVRVDLTRDCS